jgi:hypothetical protein
MSITDILIVERGGFSGVLVWTEYIEYR